MTYVGSQPGYTVTQGDAVQFGQSGGCTAFVAVLGSCFGNNPATPYIITQPPVGQATLPAWTQNSAFQGPSPYGSAVNDFYQVAMSDVNGNPMSDAIVTVITLPPTGAYWSFQSYMIERAAQYYGIVPTNCPSTFLDSNDPDPAAQHVSTPDCGYNVFGLFNNTINNAVVANYAQQKMYMPLETGFSDENLNSPVAIAIITTANSTLYTALQKAFYAPTGIAAFGSIAQIFADGMPTSGGAALNVGTASSSDIFGSIIRYNIPEVPTPAGSQWTGSPGTYINVYRVHSTGAQAGVPTQSLTAQSYNINENVVRFQNDLSQLSGLLISYLEAQPSPHSYVAVQSKSGTYDGFQCIIYGRYCQGGTEDNESYRTYQLGQVPYGSYAIAVGLLHSTSAGDTATPPGPLNNSVYTGVSWADNSLDSLLIAENEGITGGATQNNVTATGFTESPAGTLEGSAYSLLSATGLLNQATGTLPADLPDLYAVVLTRSNPSCQIALCQSSYTFVNTLLVKPPPQGLALSDILSITERAYLLPGSTTGANAAFLLGPTIICDQTVNTCQ